MSSQLAVPPSCLASAANAPHSHGLFSLWDCNSSSCLGQAVLSQQQKSNTYEHVQLRLKLLNLGLSFSDIKKEQVHLF